MNKLLFGFISNLQKIFQIGDIHGEAIASPPELDDA